MDSVHRGTGARAHHMEDDVVATVAQRGEVASTWRYEGTDVGPRGNATRTAQMDGPDRPRRGPRGGGKPATARCGSGGGGPLGR